MIRINLLPGSEQQVGLSRRQQFSIVSLAGSFLVLAMVIPFAYQTQQLGSLNREVTNTRLEIDRLNEKVKEVEKLDQLKAELENKLRVIEELTVQRTGPSLMLTDLSERTPESLWMVEFKESGQGATITGISLDNETVATFMRQLADSPYFYGVDLVETGLVDLPRAPGFKRFILRTNLDYAGTGGKAAAKEAARREKEEALAQQQGKKKK